VGDLATMTRQEGIFLYFYSNLQIYTIVLKFIKTIHLPSWATADRAYRRGPRRQHVQPTTVRLLPTAGSWVWTPRQLTVVRHDSSSCYCRGHYSRTYQLWPTAAAAPIQRVTATAAPLFPLVAPYPQVSLLSIYLISLISLGYRN
jgi:hypothetical protein